MLSGDEQVHEVADNMLSTNHNRKVHYEGRVMLWQGANRVRALEVTIDRVKRRLTAGVVVVTSSSTTRRWRRGWPSSRSSPPGRSSATFTIVHADNLVYSDDDRLAHYQGSAALVRPPIDREVEMRAYLVEEGADVASPRPLPTAR